MGHNIYVLEIS